MVEDKNEPYRRMRVFGRVQRVLFRDSARRKAAALGLKGYVRNLEDGSMELIANGPRRASRNFLNGRSAARFLREWTAMSLILFL